MVQPLECGHEAERVTCGACDRSWCDKCNPTHGPRCLFEHLHVDDDEPDTVVPFHDRDKLADYAEVVLAILEDDEDWSSDTLDGLASEAVRFRLATTDDDCRFRRLTLAPDEVASRYLTPAEEREDDVAPVPLSPGLIDRVLARIRGRR